MTNLHPDAPAFRYVTQRIRHQVADDLFGTLRVSDDPGFFQACFQVQADLLLVGLSLEHADRTPGDLHQVHLALLEGKLVGLSQGQQAQILNQTFQQVSLFKGRANVAFVGRIDSIHDAFQAAAQDRQRCAQFMSDVGQHVAPLAVVPLQGICHLVEAVTQITQIIRPLRADARLQVAASDLLGGGDHFGEWRNHPACEQQADQCGKYGQDKRCQEHRFEEAEGKTLFRRLGSRGHNEFADHLTVHPNGDNDISIVRLVRSRMGGINRLSMVHDDAVLRIQEQRGLPLGNLDIERITEDDIHPLPVTTGDVKCL